MRYGSDHKAGTRARVVETAGRVLRRDGVDGTGLIGLMKEAGLTKGGFYAHFASKDALVAEAVTAALDETATRMRASVEARPDEGGSRAMAFIDGYLRPEHVAARDTGCAIGALLSDLARASPAVRQAGAAGAAQLVQVIVEVLPDRLGHARRARAEAILGMLAGCLQLARLQADPAARDAVLSAGRQAAYLLAGVDAET